MKAGRTARTGPSFENDALLIEAATAGQGLAIVHDVYARASLDRGDLVQALPESTKTETAYYSVVRPGHAKLPKIVAFQRWLCRELQT